MNDQDTSAPRDASSSPRRLQDFENARRPHSDRMIAGVSTGIARWLGIDPVIVRVGFVVLTLVGLSGLVLYGACWLLMPEEGKDRSALGEAFGLEENEKQFRLVGLVIAGAIAIAAILGDSAWGLGGWAWVTLWVLFWIAVPIALVYWFVSGRHRRGTVAASVTPGTPHDPPSSAAPPFAATSAPAGHDSATTTFEGDSGPDDEDDGVQPPASGPPLVHGPPTPSGPPYTWSPALFLGTVSLILLAWGGLWLWSEQVSEIAPEIYAVTGLGITALGLLVGSKIGNPGLLIPVGLLLCVALAATSALPNTRAGDFTFTPTSVDQATRAIDTGAGQVTYDLSAVPEPEDLGGESVEIDHGLGLVRVIVPRDLDVHVDATIRWAGQVKVFERTADGWKPRLDYGDTGSEAFSLSISSSAGAIEVIRR
ncbi:hypothetical protein BHE97_12925 [Aeromicrobium sp. PE09-221]|uniref:PspC domain-containing protein n=1 Tax=Aeromicrobium sp. PE09-221 TaxID=1898043 RepID=UPI000B6AED91|nr:PspC domain-containing protein [Aeromicrobium sp. PE09-221]OUZ08575.1 hypothetical protein BHE97_12925 [Aeromicrobium sp. PE09-221]